MGAMCYDMCMPPPVTEYVCPVCGEKTLYPVPEGHWSTPLNSLEDLRRMQAQELQDSIEQPARSTAHSGRLAENRSHPGWS